MWTLKGVSDKWSTEKNKPESLPNFVHGSWREQAVGFKMLHSSKLLLIHRPCCILLSH